MQHYTRVGEARQQASAVSFNCMNFQEKLADVRKVTEFQELFSTASLFLLNYVCVCVFE